MGLSVANVVDDVGAVCCLVDSWVVGKWTLNDGAHCFVRTTWSANADSPRDGRIVLHSQSRICKKKAKQQKMVVAARQPHISSQKRTWRSTARVMQPLDAAKGMWKAERDYNSISVKSSTSSATTATLALTCQLSSPQLTVMSAENRDHFPVKLSLIG
jgi:hypothetical protein